MNVENVVINMKKVRGTTFLGVSGYTNASGEQASHLINLNVNFKKVLLHDLNLMKTEIEKIELLKAKYNNSAMFIKGFQELYDSLVKRTSDDETKEELRLAGDSTIKRSDAQTNAYESVCQNIKKQFDKEGNEILYIFGFRVRKTVHVEGEYKETKRQEKTLIKRDIEKTLGFKSVNFVTFFIKNVDSITFKGIKF